MKVFISDIPPAGADINAQTEETQETALTLACCGGFLEVADFLIKAGADIELGCSTPLMEAAQEGHLDLVKYLLKQNANVHAQTGTGDTALTYACENGHTDVADVLLQHGADLVSAVFLLYSRQKIKQHLTLYLLDKLPTYWHGCCFSTCSILSLKNEK